MAFDSAPLGSLLVQHSLPLDAYVCVSLSVCVIATQSNGRPFVSRVSLFFKSERKARELAMTGTFSTAACVSPPAAAVVAAAAAAAVGSRRPTLTDRQM